MERKGRRSLGTALGYNVVEMITKQPADLKPGGRRYVLEAGKIKWTEVGSRRPAASPGNVQIK